MKKAKLNKTLFHLHLQLANEWDNTWHLLYDAIHLTLENETQNTYKNLGIKLDHIKHYKIQKKNTSTPHKFYSRIINNTNIIFSENELICLIKISESTVFSRLCRYISENIEEVGTPIAKPVFYM